MTSSDPSRTTRPEIPWAAVRRDYEIQPIGLRALARRYGIRSDNQIRRRRDKEGWQRDETAIARTLLLQGASPGPDDPTTAAGLARLQGRVLAQHQPTGEEMWAAGIVLLDHLTALIGGGSIKPEDAIRRLAGVRKRDTLASLMEVATDLTCKGVGMECDALRLKD